MIAADYAWGYNGNVPGALKWRGVTIACRYLSYDPGKDLSARERDELHAAGIDTAVVWETTANRTEGGYAAGQSDANEALRRARELGMPEDRPIYFAVDEGTTVGPNISGYFKACCDVLGVGRVGAYGSIYIIDALYAMGLAKFLWQTSAWSDGKVSPNSHLYQHVYDLGTGGVSCDLNDVHFRDVGQWGGNTLNGSTPVTPTPASGGDEMAIITGLAFDGSYGFTHHDNAKVDVLQLLLAEAGGWIKPYEVELSRPWQTRYENLRAVLGSVQVQAKTGNADGTPDYIVGPKTAEALCSLVKRF